MKKVLFLGVIKLDFEKEPESLFHLKKKYEGLSQKIKPYVVARGKPFRKRIWDTEFYLIGSESFFWPMAFCISIYLCLIKRIDVIVAQSPLIEGFVGAILKKLFKKQLIVELHGDWEEGPFLSKKRRFVSVKKKFIPLLAKASLTSADKIRGVANYLIERAKKIAPEKKYYLFPTFTDLDLFSKEKNIQFKKFILLVGRLEEVKGTEYLVEAFAKIYTDFPEFKLVIVGDGSKKQELMSLVSKFNLTDRVEFKGTLSLEQTKNIIKDCYCLVLPSLSEGLPRVLIEAMVLEKPVIASRVGGIPDLIKQGENGFLVEPGDVIQLAEKLKILLKDLSLAKEQGKKGKQLAKESFSNEKYIKNYISLITDL